MRGGEQMTRVAALLALLLLAPACKRDAPERKPAAAASSSKTKDPLPALLSALAAQSAPPPPMPLDARPLSDEEKRAAQASLASAGKAPKELPKTSGPDAPCPMVITRPTQKGEVVASWLALWKRLGDEFETKYKKTYPAPAMPVTTDAEVRHVLTGALDDGKRLWVVELEDSQNGLVQWHVVARLGDGKLLLFPSIADRVVTRCGMGPRSVWFEEDGAPRVVIESVTNDLEYLCETKGGDVGPCKGGDPDEKPVQSFCAPGTYSMRFLFLDLEKQDIPLVLEESGSQVARVEKTSRVMLGVQPDGVSLTGLGCSGKVFFRQ